MKQELIHFKPNNKNWNVSCGNGNYHAYRTEDIRNVTCPVCLSEDGNGELKNKVMMADIRQYLRDLFFK